jgi:hypothetical protein
VRRWAAGVAVVAVGWLASPATVPVYDGVSAPDQPYRFAGSSSAPVAVSKDVDVSGGASASVLLQSAEQGPQVVLNLGEGAFTSTATRITVTATPLKADAQPPRGSVDGNVYRFTASPGATLLPDKAQGFVFLRAAVMTKPAPVIVHRSAPNDPWTELKTTVVGRDNLSTPFRALGDYAVVRLPGAKGLDQTGLSTTRVLLLAGGVLLLLVLTVLVLRRPRTDED